MTIALALALKNARLQAIVSALDTAATPGHLQVYGGTQPAAGEAVTDQPLLATLMLAKPSATVAEGVLTFNATSEVLALATGEPTWGRWLDGGGGWVMDMVAGGPESSAPLKVSPSTLYEGGTVRVDSATLAEP